ncbi:hypothetical protein YQE_05663, partial [Dendroctonus ponderosae]
MGCFLCLGNLLKNLALKPLCFIAAVINLAEAVKINRLRVPDMVKYGTEAILDCDFTLDDSETDLVVKWYFNTALVYQWIPSTKNRPQSLGVLKDRVNLNHQASVDANSIHRALHILNTGPDLSGNFTCSVSTLESEDEKTKGMLVLGQIEARENPVRQ